MQGPRDSRAERGTDRAGCWEPRAHHSPGQCVSDQLTADREDHRLRPHKDLYLHT